MAFLLPRPDCPESEKAKDACDNNSFLIPAHLVCLPDRPVKNNIRCGYIYVLKCPYSHLVRYVGKTFSLRKRIYEHLHYRPSLKRNPRNNWVLSLNKKGDTPIFEIVDDCDEFDWSKKERYYIKLYRSLGVDLLNISEGGDAGNFKFNSSDETRKKISEALKKRPPCKIRNKNISNGILNKLKNDPDYAKKRRDMAKEMSRKGGAARRNWSKDRKNKWIISMRVAWRKRSKFTFCVLAKSKILRKFNGNTINESASILGITWNDLHTLEVYYIKAKGLKILKS